jgi:hypothetical protein
MSNPDTFDDYQLPPQLPTAPEPNGGGNGLTIRSMNANQGAVRVGVKREMQDVYDRVRLAASYGGRSFEYRIPFKKRVKDERGRPVMENGKPKVITEYVVGPTIDCTNAVAACYGNCDLGAEIVEIRPEAYVINATFLDIETGFRMSRPFIQAKDRNIGSFGGDTGRQQEAITGIGISKALRNVTRNALGPLVEFCVEQARRSQVAKIEKYRPEAEAAVIARCEEFGVPLARVERYYRTKLKDMSDRVVAQVLGLLNSVKDEMIRPDEMCPEGDAAPVAGEPVAEREEREREDETRTEQVDDDGVVTTNDQEAQQGAQEPRQEPETKEEAPKSGAKSRAAGKAAKPPAPPATEEEPKQAQVYWQVFSPDGKVARRMPADPEGWWLAFSDENEAVPKAQRQTFYNANMRRLREVAETIPVAKTFLEFIEKA